MVKLYNPNPENKVTKLRPRLEQIENLRNPIVQTAMGELRKLVNCLIDEFLKEGEHFDEIKVELARELKQSTEDRKNNFQKKQ